MCTLNNLIIKFSFRSWQSAVINIRQTSCVSVSKFFHGICLNVAKCSKMRNNAGQQSLVLGGWGLCAGVCVWCLAWLQKSRHSAFVSSPSPALGALNLSSLEAQCHISLKQGLASSTCSSYLSSQKTFHEFCVQVGKIHQSGSPCSTDEWTLCLWPFWPIQLNIQLLNFICLRHAYQARLPRSSCGLSVVATST